MPYLAQYSRSTSVNGCLTTPITVELVTETAAGTNVSWRYTECIGNIHD